VERVRQEARQGKEVRLPVHDDLVRRDFTATCANRLWFADITEHATGEGKLYLCAVKDVSATGSWAIRSTRA
jgi:putative transposase